jgi:AraC-like DNA-binding protein
VVAGSSRIARYCANRFGDLAGILIAVVRPADTAGAATGLDLALTLLEEELGAELARQVTVLLVMFFKCGGSQMQFSRHGAGAPVGRSALQEVQRCAAACPAEDHNVEHLTAGTGMISRYFARLFRADTGLILAAYIEAVWIETARRLLESGDTAMKQIAGALGLRDAEALQCAFVRRIGTTPVGTSALRAGLADAHRGETAGQADDRFISSGGPSGPLQSAAPHRHTRASRGRAQTG